MRYIVTTTINPPTKALEKFAQMDGWTLIVVGDKKTPHDAYKDYNYIHPDKQEDKYKKLSDAIGWNCIQRRNIGIVEAYNLGASVIALVDDDNIPYDNWGKDLTIDKTILADYYETQNPVFDPLSVTNYPHLWHRGYPIELLPTKNQVVYKGKREIKPLIQADLWDGDPDIDAICRITYRPNVKFNVTKPYFSNAPAPFNSQNTFIHRSVVKDYFLYPDIGRMDDIWAAYAVSQYPLVFAPASVYQERNQHDLVKDMENEMIGYQNTLRYLKGEVKLDPSVINTYRGYLE